MDAATEVAERIKALDPTLFDGIEAQLSQHDRASLLAVQRALRAVGPYTYLEIGSYKGGSLQSHWLDPECQQMYSIDNREYCHFADDPTEHMRDNLQRLAVRPSSDLVCFVTDVAGVNPDDIHETPAFCFIDGFHTSAAAILDFQFCLKVCHHNAAICFHDSRSVAAGIQTIIDWLKSQQLPFTARKLTGYVFVIMLGDCAAKFDEFVNCQEDGEMWLRRQLSQPDTKQPAES